MLEELIGLLSLTFFRRALIVGILVSLSAALLGVSLVLKRYSMIGDGLSHVGFCTLSIAAVMNWAPLYFSIPIVVLAAFLLLRLSENGKIKGDAATALITTSSLAIGVIVTSLGSGMTTDVNNYMFGSILIMSKSDVTLSVILSVAVLTLFVLFYNKLLAVTFDESFAKATGIKAGLYNMLLAILTALTIVLGMRMMGTLLISGLIVFPALTSMGVFKKFKSVIICSAIVSVICFITGMFGSYIFSTPAGASVVVANLITFVVFRIVGTICAKAKK